jgi:hypothetical protein
MMVFDASGAGIEYPGATGGEHERSERDLGREHTLT